MSFEAIRYRFPLLSTVSAIISILSLSLSSIHQAGAIGWSIEDEDPEKIQSGMAFDVRFNIRAGRVSDCYAHTINPGEVIVGDFQVVQSIPGHKLDVEFKVWMGEGHVVLENLGPRDSVNFKDESLVGGTYHLCFYNYHDTTYDKEILFYLSSYK